MVNGLARPDPHFVALLRDAARAAPRQRRRGLSPRPADLPLPGATGARGTPSGSMAEEAGAARAISRARRMSRRGSRASLAFDIVDRLGEIRAPTLAIAAEDDMLVPASCSKRSLDGTSRRRRRRHAVGRPRLQRHRSRRIQRHSARLARRRPLKELAMMEVGIFTPIGNNGWLICENSAAIYAELRSQQGDRAQRPRNTASISCSR